MATRLYPLRQLRQASDVTDAVLFDAESVYDSWFADEHRIDWDHFIDRLSDEYGPYSELPYELTEYDNEAVRKIKRHIRSYAQT